MFLKETTGSTLEDFVSGIRGRNFGESGVPLTSLQSRLLGNLSKKAGANFVFIVKGERVVRPTDSLETPMRPVLPRDLPADSDQPTASGSCDGEYLFKLRRHFFTMIDQVSHNP